MEQIIITKPDGSKYPLANKRTATEIKSAKQNWALLADDVVSVNIESPFQQPYGIGDHFAVFGRAYKLNRLPKVKKTGMHAFSYDLEFEGIQYDLIRATYDLTIDTTNNQLQDVQADTLTGNLRRFATVLISNANRVFPSTWVLGSCPDTIEDKTLTFGEGDNCLSVLQTLCTEFGVEFEILQSNGKFIINFISKVGQTFPFTFEFGKGKGLYSLDRQNVDSSNIITRLKVYGSTSNITNKYRASRLCLPGKTKAQSYIEKPEAVAKYGIYEATKYFDDIKPTFNGSITGLVSGSVLKFIDTKMFDLNALEADGKTTKYLIDGCAAKIHFNTGNLAGYEFEVHAYDHATKTFTLVKQTDDRGDVFPSESSSAFQFAKGDEYKLLDVSLPEIPYLNDAENKLYEQGNIYYDQNSQPKVQYGLSVTKAYLKTLVGDGTTVNIFAPGDYIPVKDSDIDVDKSVRIKSLTRNLLDEYEYTLTISDTVTTNITNRVISELIDIDKVITINNLKDPVRARANWRSSREVLNMVFDPEGDYYTDKIKPNSIDTLALSVGAKSMQFGLTNTVLQPNFNGNKNSIKVQGGVLTHYTINEESARSWVLADNTTTFDNDGQAYYIYAKCSKAGTNGSIIFSTAQIKVEQDAMFYHFWIGVVNSVDAELKARSVALSYGFTMINGRFIKTGRIESADGLTYFDLDNSEICGRIRFVDGLMTGFIEIGNEASEVSAFVNGDQNKFGGSAFSAGVSNFGSGVSENRILDLKHRGYGSKLGVFRIEENEVLLDNGEYKCYFTSQTVDQASPKTSVSGVFSVQAPLTSINSVYPGYFSKMYTDNILKWNESLKSTSITIPNVSTKVEWNFNQRYSGYEKPGNGYQYGAYDWRNPIFPSGAEADLYDYITYAGLELFEEKGVINYQDYIGDKSAIKYLRYKGNVNGVLHIRFRKKNAGSNIAMSSVSLSIFDYSWVEVPAYFHTSDRNLSRYLSVGELYDVCLPGNRDYYRNLHYYNVANTKVYDMTFGKYTDALSQLSTGDTIEVYYGINQLNVSDYPGIYDLTGLNMEFKLSSMLSNRIVTAETSLPYIAYCRDGVIMGEGGASMAMRLKKINGSFKTLISGTFPLQSDTLTFNQLSKGDVYQDSSGNLKVKQ